MLATAMDAVDRTRCIERARTGDAEAFASLIDLVSMRLWLFIRKTAGRGIGADCDADDLYQLTIERAWSLLRDFQETGPESLYRWLVAIAGGVIGNRLHYVAAKRRGEVRHIESFAGGEAAWAPFDSRTSLSSLVARRDDLRAVERALAALDPQARRLVERTILDGATLNEVASECGLPRSTAWDLLSRALGDLRRLTAGRDFP
jgi:RNA polymerase sigma factor (sigma-70 family)